MSTPSEQWVAAALRDATDRLPLPPESRWVRERPSSQLFTVATVVIAVTFILAVGSALNALKGVRLIPATSADPFVAADEAAWQQIRATLPGEVLVLRPTYLPAQFRTIGTTDCPSPSASAQQANRAYDVQYRTGASVSAQGKPENSSCVRLEFSIAHQPEGTVSPGLVDVGTISARGTSIRVRYGTEFTDRFTGVRRHLVYLDWIESGVTYEISTFDLDIPELTRIVQGLEPIRSSFTAADDAAWSSVRSVMPSDVTVLRPTWLPDRYQATSTQCPSPAVAFGGPQGGLAAQGGLHPYTVRYNAPPVDRICASISVTQYRFSASGGVRSMEDEYSACDNGGTVAARGTQVYIFKCPANGPAQYRPFTYLFWVEAGVANEVGSDDLMVVDLLRVVQSLEPVR